MTEVTRILPRIESGDPAAAEQLLPLVYDELRKLAAARLAQEKPGQTLQATALVHEAYIKLVCGGQPEHSWDNRGHFFAAAAESMRRILLNRARDKQRLKRSPPGQRIDLKKIEVAMETSDGDHLHGPTRWLLNYNFNPATGNLSLYATSTNDGWTVLLADGQSMTGHYDFQGYAVWSKDDSFVSVVTRDWTDDAAYSQLYRATVSFDVDGTPSISSDWEWVTSGDVPGTTDINNYDWSGDGTQVALGMVPNNGTLPYIKVCDLLTATTTVLATASYNPRWSPTTDRIAYKPFNQGIFTVNPDGSGLTQLTTGNMDLPHDWSPDGNYILFGTSATKTVKGGQTSVQVGDVCYVAVAGGKAVNLTGDINGYATPRWWR
ncbi:MAG: hypothetical protein H6822_27055 [Planctomycetaceae bacterium]|nr:hypothetical protein [Planctomycetales bacterium]MCB9925839.1 hypothetical protein [Planctomycetaceae bacterium]